VDATGFTAAAGLSGLQATGAGVEVKVAIILVFEGGDWQ